MQPSSHFSIQHPWRLMAVVFAAVLLVSFVVQRLFSPAGDAALRLTGAGKAEPGSRTAGTRSGR